MLGAVTAQGVSEQVPLEQRFVVWTVGSLLIFLGLIVVSLGVKSRLGPEEDDQEGGRER